MSNSGDADLFPSNAIVCGRRYIAVPKTVYSDAALENDLVGLNGVWKEFQRRRDRDAVYTFLSEVFRLVAWWIVEMDEDMRAIRILDESGVSKIPDDVEPFAAVIIAAAAPKVLDKRLVSKWSRVLRYAAKYKDPSQRLGTFIKRRGGLNACAARYARRLGRGAIE
jgi:hypothetical protein